MSIDPQITGLDVQGARATGSRLRRSLRLVVPFALAILLAVALVLILLPVALNRAELQSRVKGQIEAWSGLSLAVKGDATLSFFPFRATITDVASKDAIGAFSVSADKIEARFSALALLTGNVVIKELSLDGAHLTLRQAQVSSPRAYLDKTPLRSEIAIVKAAIAAESKQPDLNILTNRPLGRVRLANSTASLIWSDGREDRLADINLTADWPNLRGSAQGSGSASWRGEEVAFDLSVAEPLVVLSGGTSGLQLDLKSTPLNFSFSGDASMAPEFYAQGKLALHAPSISRVLSWSAAPMSASGALGAIDVDAVLSTAEGKLSFGELQLSLDGNPATGTLEIDTKSEMPRLNGTLAFQALDFASLSEALQLGQSNPSQQIVVPASVSGVGLDLRLSAESATVGAYQLKNAAGTVRLDPSGIQLDLGNADTGNGNLTGSLRVTGPQGGREAELKVSGRGLMPDLIYDSGSVPALSAPVDFQLALSGAYNGWQDFLQRGDGTLSASSGKGMVRNFTAEGFAGQVRVGRIFALPDVYSGFSMLDSATFEASVRQGVAIIESGEILMGGQRIVLAGALPLLSGGVALNGILAPQSDTDTAVPFFIGGAWDKPFVTLVPIPK